MSNTSRNRHRFVAAIALAGAIFTIAPAFGEDPADEHAKHHPAPAPGPGGEKTNPSGGGMGGMMDEMMKKMSVSPPKDLYPSLMDLPELTQEQRSELQSKAQERMKAGVALMNQALDQLLTQVSSENHQAMQETTDRLREGLNQFETGMALKRALAEGKAPRDVALTWFKKEMDLLPVAVMKSEHGILGISWFHAFVMILLTGFAVVMIGLYFRKMRRAGLLLERLTAPPALTASQTGHQSMANRPVTDVLPKQANAVPVLPGPVAAPSGIWSGRLQIARIFMETDEVKTFRLVSKDLSPIPFAFLPGQFLQIEVNPEGKPVRHFYTISSAPSQRDYVEITVKKEPEGHVSRFLHERLREGDEVQIRAPMGAFVFTGKEADSLVLVSGGVGITPMMSVLRYLTSVGWKKDVYFLYCCRTTHDFIFREELEYLQKRSPNLHVVVSLTRADGTSWFGPTGRFTKELIANAVPEISKRRVHVCGPAPMMQALKGMLAELGVPPGQIKTETFGNPLGNTNLPSETHKETVLEGGSPVQMHQVTFATSKNSCTIKPGQTILELADAIGVEIESSCHSGTCGTCKVKLLEGQVSMECQDALTPEDKAQGIVLACQAKPQTNVSVQA